MTIRNFDNYTTEQLAAEAYRQAQVLRFNSEAADLAAIVANLALRIAKLEERLGQ